MFTGLVECVGTVDGSTAVPHGIRLEVSTGWQGDVRRGDSVAVNGVCLTVVDVSAGRLTMDVGPETLRVTTLGRLVPGHRINLERALRAGDRVGGHFVQGHVDTVGTLLDVRGAEEFTWMVFSFPAQHESWIIPKGAIAVDGISLTVATLGTSEFAVQVVPFTWAHTSLPELRQGDAVNLEFDMLGKYAVRAAQLAARGIVPVAAEPPLT
jgi:riboflavin synthase